jgi:hypothetical protein
MQITFELPHVFEPGSSSKEEAIALRKLLDCLIALDVAYLDYRKRIHHTVPSLYNSGVVYRRTETWCSTPALYELGYGDCKSLSAALIAERRVQGRIAVPRFRFYVRPNGYKGFHVLVETDAGMEDPSRRLGMGSDENVYFPSDEQD